MSLEYAHHARALRHRLFHPANAVPDTGIALKHPKSVTGYQAERNAREATAMSQEAAKQVTEDRLLKALNSASEKPRDWLRISPLPDRADKLPIFFHKKIMAAVLDEYRISIVDIFSRRRERKIATPRHVIVYLCKMLTPMLLNEIGRALAGRDHTTILSSYRRIEKLILTDAFLCQTVIELQLGLEQEIAKWRAGD